MTYCGIVSNGVIILEGEKPRDGTVVEVTPIDSASIDLRNPAEHPAIGIWKGRTDLPEDSIEASKMLRAALMSSER